MGSNNRKNIANLYFSARIKEDLKGIFDYPLTMVEAPMGYGKTTAIRYFLEHSEAEVFWQSLYDNVFSDFWMDFAKQFQAIDPSRAQSLIELQTTCDNMPIDEVVHLLEGIQLTQKTVWVIDDYHLISNPLVNDFMEAISQRDIKNLHIVLNARFFQFENKELMILKRNLYHVDKEAFELLPKEISKYFKKCGFDISDREAERLYLDTEGWISALYLFMLEYAKKGTYTPSDSIYKLLDQAVYRFLNSRMKDFLLSISVFDYFTLEQATYFWEGEDPGALLSELVSSNLFITYDVRKKIYSIHNIFLGLLREKLEQESRDKQVYLYKRAADYFFTHSNWRAARSYYYKCQDYNAILHAIEADRSNDYSAENRALLKHYIEACPQDVKAQNHYALLVYAMHLFIGKELNEFNEICLEIEHNIHNDLELCEEDRKSFLGELEFLKSFSEFNDLKKMAHRHQKAWQLLKRPTAVYHCRNKWAFGIPSVLSLYYRESGKLTEHIEDLKLGMPKYYALTNGHGSGAEYVMEAEICFNKGDFENAGILVQKALLKSQANGDENIIFSARYFQILIAFMKEDIEEVMALIEMIHQSMEKNQSYSYYFHVVEICEACIYVYLDQLDRVPERLLKSQLNNPRIVFQAYPFFNIFYGRMLLVTGEYLKLIGSAEHFMGITSIFNNLLGDIYTYTYLAAAYRKIYRDREGVEALKKALEIAVADQQYMIFVENCDYIEPLLDIIYREGHYQDDIDVIRRLYSIYKVSKSRIIAKYFTDEQEALTERELEIAQLASLGKTNKEIGQHLYISSNTVKKALQSIYKKLGINSRVLLKKYLEESSYE